MKTLFRLPGVAALALVLSAASSRADSAFTETEPLPRNQTIRSLVGAGEVLVASGSMTRLSGVSWQETSGPVTVFAHKDGKFHGWRYTVAPKAVIQTSADGVNWTDVGSGREFDGISTAAYHGGKYLVAYTRFNRDQILVSNDNGVSWTETIDVIKPAGINGDRFASGYGFGRWFLCGGSSVGAGFLSSTDGVAWSPVTVPEGTPTAGFGGIGMCFDAGVGLVSVANSLLRTTDGVAWTEAKRFSNGLSVAGIAHNNGSFLLGRTDFSQKFTLEVSSDLGASFSVIPNVHQNRIGFIANLSQVRAVTAWKTGFAIAGDNGFVLGTEDISLGEPSFQRLTDGRLYHFGSYPYRIVANGPTLARYFTGGTPGRVQTSADGGFTWSEGVVNPGGATGSAEFLALGGKYFLRDARNLVVSDDALTWTQAQSTDKNPEQFDAKVWAHSIVFDGSRWVAIIEEFVGSGYARFLSESHDGVNWTKTGTVPVGPESGNERLIMAGGEYFYVSTDFTSVRLHRSSDLSGWTEFLPPASGFTTTSVRVYREANRWLVMGMGAVRVSDDGVEFFAVPNGTVMPIGHVIGFGGKYYAPGNNTTLVSDDLLLWRETSTPRSLQTFVTGNANGLLLADGFSAPSYIGTLPVALPAEPSSGPTVAIAPAADGRIRISIPTEAGKFYYIETSPKLSLPLWNYDFANFPSIEGDGTVKEIEFVPTTPSGFFRITVF